MECQGSDKIGTFYANGCCFGCYGRSLFLGFLNLRPNLTEEQFDQLSHAGLFGADQILCDLNLC